MVIFYSKTFNAGKNVKYVFYLFEMDDKIVIYFR